MWVTMTSTSIQMFKEESIKVDHQTLLDYIIIWVLYFEWNGRIQIDCRR